MPHPLGWGGRTQFDFGNLYLLITKAPDVIFLHTKFNVKNTGKTTFNWRIEAAKSFK